jgi:curli biogenesis system outer membrane secretion channel CsgG
MIAIALLAVLTVFSHEDTQTPLPPAAAHYQTAQYAVPPSPVMTVCNVNGVDYQIDYSNRIWAINSFGNWFVLGRIVNTPNGTLAIRTDGARFPASC